MGQIGCLEYIFPPSPIYLLIQTLHQSATTECFSRIGRVSVQAGTYKISDNNGSDPSPIYIQEKGVDAFVVPIYSADVSCKSMLLIC